MAARRDPKSKPLARPGAGATRPKATPARAKATPAKAPAVAAARTRTEAAPARPRRMASRPVSTRGPTSRAMREGPGPVVYTPDLEGAKALATAAATRWALVTARDVMRHDLVTVSKDTPISELEKILAERRISGAPVTDADGVIVGVVSMRDLVDHYSRDVGARPSHAPSWFEIPFEHVLPAEEYAPVAIPPTSEETAADLMTTDVVSVPADAGIREISRTMTEHRVHRVLVERDGVPGTYIGLVGTFEILDMLAE